MLRRERGCSKVDATGERPSCHRVALDLPEGGSASQSLVCWPITRACDSADKAPSLRVSHCEALWPSVGLAHRLHVPGEARREKNKAVVVPTVCFLIIRPLSKEDTILS